ncbi:MAG TPA: alpha-amylase, partial [Flavobacterium sp.]
YGDESDRSLVVEGTQGDATLRSFMNWDAIKTNSETQKTMLHWQKLGQFRRNHPCVGAGIHKQLTARPYTFSRTFTKGDYFDSVVIGLDLPLGKKEITVGSVFKNGIKVRDGYSGKTGIVSDGKVSFDTNFSLLLIENQ